MKKTITVLMVALIFTSIVIAFKPDTKEFNLPSNAIKVAPGLYKLGYAFDNEGRLVEGYAIFKYKENNGKPAEKPVKPTGETTCYSFLASGAKWKSFEPYYINPTNSEGLDEGIITNNFGNDINTWESAAGKDIIAYGSSTSNELSADTSSTDNKNEVYFGSIGEENAIAVTIVWGIFGGPPKTRELVEWDMVFDESDFDWSLNGDLYKMDFDNIATHELGHTLGLADLYTADCAEQTMYGYASNGETNKQTLAIGDITGIKKLYS